MKKLFQPLPWTCVFAVGVFTTQIANAASISVPNFSFEDQTIADNAEVVQTSASINNVVTGWLSGGAYQAYGASDPNNGKFAGSTGDNAALPAPADGGQAAFINAGGSNYTPANPTPATLTSAASLLTIADDTTYTLTIAIGNALGTGTQVPGVFKIALLANGVEVTNFAYQNANLIADGAFADFSTSFSTGGGSALSGQALTIQFSTDSATGNGNAQVFLDNVRLDASAVPEPGSWAMMLGGLGMLVGFQRRRRLV